MSGTVRYAVVGLGHIAQAAVLPAFARCENSVLTALVSGDAEKRVSLARRYGVAHVYDYEQFDCCIHNPEVDAVYIALPNDKHAEYTIRAGLAGVHVLCEKPMAVTSEECAQMIDACREGSARLMIAYRLHFDEANLAAIEAANSGNIGEVRFFSSEFAMQVRPGNIRLRADRGGGPVYDIGIYCINAARYLFRDEPVEVTAFAGNSSDERFGEVDEMVTCLLRFPNDRLASFTCSFGAASVDRYTVYGTKGNLRVQPCYEYQGKLKHYLTVDGKTEEREFPEGSQFAAELDYFSRCVLDGCDPEPGGEEGLADVLIIEAVHKSMKCGHSVRLTPFSRDVQKPGIEQAIRRPQVQEPEMVHAESPFQD